MNDDVRILYETMLIEDVREVYQEPNGECIEITIGYADDYGARRWVIVTLEPKP